MRHSVKIKKEVNKTFQFTHPVRGATLRLRGRSPSSECFNSRTPCGVRHRSPITPPTPSLFQFTHPVRGATAVTADVVEVGEVSIHAPRAGCDDHIDHSGAKFARFNSRTPCGVRPDAPPRGAGSSRSFNSRTPCGVRPVCQLHWRAPRCFNSRTPCGVRRQQEVESGYRTDVSIHAPRAGCDYVF